MVQPSEIAEALKAKARELGANLVGIAPAGIPDTLDQFRDWLDAGYAGDMAYLPRSLEARSHPRSVLAEVRSVVMLGFDYDRTRSPELPTYSGQIAGYAQGPDYHDILRAKLNELSAWLETVAPGSRARGVVDSAPLLERDFARRAGLGWFGNNTMLISKSQGSFFLLAALLTSLELPADPPFTSRHCGTCTACLDACPTKALVAPGRLDARRCISYLTIELKTSIPEELRPGIGNWIFGCDICQDVCPWNRHAMPTEFPHRHDLETVDPLAILQMDDNAFRECFRGTPMMRTKRRGLQRNAAIVLGNVGNKDALAILQQVADSAEEMVAEAARWAMGRILKRGNVPDSCHA